MVFDVELSEVEAGIQSSSLPRSVYKLTTITSSIKSGDTVTLFTSLVCDMARIPCSGLVFT